MSNLEINNAQVSDLTNKQEDYSVPSAKTDGSDGQKEKRHFNNNWTKYLGYYVLIPELKRAIDIISTWAIGKGWEADDDTTEVLRSIRGIGSDSFDTVLENQVRTMFINGDSYAEIIRDEDGELINLKPIAPDTMVIISNKQGMIERFEQINQVDDKLPPQKFDTEQIFHLSRNRIANSILGQSIIKELEFIILARNEAMADWKKVMHRNVNPVRIWHLDTDVQADVDRFVAKIESTINNVENVFVPRGNVEVEISSVAPNASLNGIPWIRELNSYFYEATGVPEIVAGSGKQFTDASSKIKYLVWQQSVEEIQLYVEEQVGLQLGMEINLVFPASLEQGIVQEQQKEGQLQASRPNDVIAELEGVT